MEQARSQVLARARAGSDAGLKAALALVTQLVPEQGFADLMDHLASQRARLASLLALGPAGAEAKLRAALGLKPGETAASILEAACRDQAFDGPGLRRAAAMMLASQSKDDKEHGAWLAGWLEHQPRRAQGFDEYCRVFFTQKGTKRQRFMTKSLADASPDLASAMEAE